MSRPIGAHFHVAHGLSNAMLLPAVTAFSVPAAEPVRRLRPRVRSCRRRRRRCPGGREVRGGAPRPVRGS
ncbi:iron-containing alcohol dehydrogenase [Streptomyces sp. NPDC127079]|uniref:iron-containing alcohol dehydrogenase n=1 Tax=Streptomyces sp. NPDC127079 TaxID=3347132 RepID=UPI00364B08FE